MSTEFVISGVLPGKLNALVKNLMRQTGQTDPNEAVRLINSGEWVVSQSTRSWREEDGVIYFSVTSDGTEGEDWIPRLERKSFRVGDYAKQALCSPSFKPTSGMTTEVAVLKGMLFEDQSRTTSNIRAEADKRKLQKPNTELACLIREKFTDREIEAMGLRWIVAMHEPVSASRGYPSMLGAGRGDDGRWLITCCGRPDDEWGRGNGFAFDVSRDSTSTSA